MAKKQKPEELVARPSPRQIPPALDKSGRYSGGEYRVLVGNAAGLADKKVLEQATVLSVFRSTGGKSLARATFELLLTEPISDVDIWDKIQDVEIRGPAIVPSESGAQSYASRTYFWGKTSGLHLQVGQERVIIEAAQAPYHFGNYVEGMWEMNPQTARKQLLRADLVFNPTFDMIADSGKRGSRQSNSQGVTRGNMDARTGGKGSYKLFLDPQRVVTAKARQYATDGAEKPTRNFSEAIYLASDLKWTLAEVVYYLCWTCNEDQVYFKNPSRDDLKILDDSEDLIRDLRVPLGEYLPEALDRVLNPYGYSWRVDYDQKRQIIPFRRGSGGLTKQLYLQHQKDVHLKPGKSTQHETSLAVGVQTVVNQVEIIGDYKLFEGTYELKRAWPANKDADAGDLDKISSASPTWNDRPEDHRTWRDFVLNEAGDYNGTREGYATFDFKPVFGGDGDIVPRRRRFHPCIASETDRQAVGRHGYIVEYSINDGEAWLPIEQAGDSAFEVLTSECGIRFIGTMPPDAIMFGGDAIRVRITASVYSDERIRYVAERNKKSAQDEVSAMLIDCSDRFFFRRVTPSSRHSSGVNRGRIVSSQVDDTLRMKFLADRIVNAWDQLDVSGTVTIPYLNTNDQYELGDLIESIAGREIVLDIKATSEKRYPQITGINWDFQEQSMTLTLETFRDTRFL